MSPSRARSSVLPHPLELFHPATRAWFSEAFPNATPAQLQAWPPIVQGQSTLLLAPTGSGKTLAAFLACLDKLMFGPKQAPGCKVVYVSPLKALAVDVERNLRAPLVGIARHAAAMGVAHQVPTVAVRSGDTPASQRARFSRAPDDILITTPESLYLMLTSEARKTLQTVETVIIDEIHALVPTKRGAHLALSLERLGIPFQRIGLSATQRPLEEVARFLGGVESAPRPVQIVDAGSRRQIDLRIEVPVEDMARMGAAIDMPSGPASQGPVRASIWTAIHPRLLELIRTHSSTLIFVNSRRITERLAGALNELAGEVLAQAHHGSIAREQRLQIEDNLKLGRVRALVATSSLELGIDMGAIDLVIQIEAPPSVASGLQRIGRAGHQVNATSKGVLFPKYRGDLVACAALSHAMEQGEVEAIRYPRNPLDVLAQHLVAMVSMEPWEVDALFARVRQAAPFAELSRPLFESVLDMLSGRYASEDLSDLRPRLTWDRINGKVKAREGAKRIAIANGGTIPDRGLYGVFLAGAPPGKGRVGELDEEMVFESRPGETFTLGASTWRIEEITHDRVLVSPAPGEPGKMPFWHGDSAGRSVAFGQSIGQLVRELRAATPAASRQRLVSTNHLDPLAADNLLRYLEDQATLGTAVPDDRTIVVERTRDELGDWRICVLSPLGGRVLAPWAMAATVQARRRFGWEVESMWANDGFVLRVPESDAPPDTSFLFPEPDELEALVLSQLGSTALFAAKFRECASRALLLPRRRPGGRTPLWQQRKRSSDLLAATAKFSGFPILLEAYRECLRDVFDLPALVTLLQDLRARRMRSVTVDTQTPSPFASSILMGYVANYIYDGDAPLAERRAQVLSIDQAQLKELIGELELRDVLDTDTLDEVQRQLQHLHETGRAKSADGVHDLLLRLGDLSHEEMAQRCLHPESLDGWLQTLKAERRVLPVRMGLVERWIAAEDAGRYRDALGIALPPGLPEVFLQSSPHAWEGLALRYARTHAPFSTAELAGRYQRAFAEVERSLEKLQAAGRLLEGAFRPGGAQREWCDSDVLRSIRRRSLAKLRKEIEPVDSTVLGRFESTWHGLSSRRAGLDALLDVIDKLQGYPLVASTFERDVLVPRIEGYTPGAIDALAAAGEVVWMGLEPLGEHDGKIALYLTDELSALRSPAGGQDAELSTTERAVFEVLQTQGASFYTDLQIRMKTFPADVVDALWGLVWKGKITNDSFHALRAYTTQAQKRRRRERPVGFRSRRVLSPTAGGRWTTLDRRAGASTAAHWATAISWKLLSRYGLVTREVAQAEGIPGGFSALHDVFVKMEEAGRIRRGYFISGVGAMQFALPEVLDILRSLREPPELPETHVLAAGDPANPWGALLKWPELPGLQGVRGPTRMAGARVVLVNGALAAHLTRGGRQLLAWIPETEPERTQTLTAVAKHITTLGRKGEPTLIAEINGRAAVETDHPLQAALMREGYTRSSEGLYLSRRSTVAPEASDGWEDSTVRANDDDSHLSDSSAEEGHAGR